MSIATKYPEYYTSHDPVLMLIWLNYVYYLYYNVTSTFYKVIVHKGL